jgi:ABC-type multidrug transport system fused ATPase/permease subunit
MKLPFGQYGHLLITYLRPQGRRVLALTVLLLSSIALQIVNPLLLRYFIDTAQNPQSELQSLYIAAGLFIGISLATQVLSLARRIPARSWPGATNDLIQSRCTACGWIWCSTRSHARRADRADRRRVTSRELLSQFVVRVLGNVIVLGVLIVLSIEDYRIGVVMTVLAILL